MVVVVVAAAGRSKVQAALQAKVISVTTILLGAAHPLLQVMVVEVALEALVAEAVAEHHLEAVVVAHNNLIPLDSGPVVATGALGVEVSAGHQARDLPMDVAECKGKVVEVGMVGQHRQPRLAMYLLRSPLRCSRPSTGAMVADLSWTCRQ